MSLNFLAPRAGHFVAHRKPLACYGADNRKIIFPRGDYLFYETSQLAIKNDVPLWGTIITKGRACIRSQRARPFSRPFSTSPLLSVDLHEHLVSKKLGVTYKLRFSLEIINDAMS